MLSTWDPREPVHDVLTRNAGDARGAGDPGDRLPILQRLSRGPRRRARRQAGNPGAPISRRPELRPDQPLGPVRPSLRGDLGGRPADRPRAGDPVRLPAGPDLAGRRRLPGRRGAGHDGAGASTRRGGRSLASLARQEIGRPAGIAATIAILYIIIIALAGLGIVVVKALGGEEVPLKAGTVLVYPEASSITTSMKTGGPRIYDVPAQTTYRFGEAAEQAMLFHEPFRLAVPAGSTLKSDPRGKGLVLPEKARRLVPGSSWGTFTIACTIPIALFVGWYMYRLRKGKVVEASIIGGVAVLGATVAGALVPGSPLEPYFSLSRDGDGLRAGGLWLRRGRLACLAAALPARLSFQLPQDRHDLSAGDRRHRGQPEARGTHDQPVLRRAAAGPTSTDRSSLMYSSASCAGRFRGFTRWSPRERRPRWSTRRATSG